MKKIIYYFFLGGLFLNPFIFNLSAPIPYEVPRVWFILRWMEVLIGLTLLNSFLSKHERSSHFTLPISVLIFAGLAFVLSFLGVDFTKSFWGNYYRVDGLFTLLHLVGFFFVIYLNWEKNWEGGLKRVVTFSALLVSAYTLFAFVDRSMSIMILPPNMWPAPFGQLNFLAGYLVVSLPFAFSYIKRNVIKALGLIVIFLAILTTQSWGGILGFFLFLASLFLLKRGVSRKNLLLGSMSITLTIAISYFVWQSYQPLVAESRVRIITKGLLASKEKPLLGWGWANFDHAFESVDWPLKLDKDVYADKAHSTFLEILVTTGLIGLIAFLFILIQLVKHLTSKSGVSEIWFMTFLLYIIHAQTNIISISEELIFWLILGVVGSHVPIQKAKKELSS